MPREFPNIEASRSDLKTSVLHNCFTCLYQLHALHTVIAVDLSVAITSEAMIPVLANAEVQQRLIPLLPEAAELPKTEAELRETMHSPQFHQVPNVCCVHCWFQLPNISLLHWSLHTISNYR